MFWQQLVNGITIGSVYALVALGFSMVYGVLSIINWAHADVLMFGTFIALTIYQKTGNVPLALLAVAGGVVTALLGMIIERAAYRPVKKNRKVAILVSALGVSCLLQNLAQIIWGSTTQQFPIFTPVYYTFGSVSFSNVQITITAVTLVMLLILYIVVYRTRLGIAMRATANSTANAKLMGIDTNMIISLTFGIGAFVAGVGGVMIGGYYNSVYPTMGYLLGMKAFAAAIFGGIGSVPGAVVGGYLIGIIESLGTGYISSAYQDAYAFIVMIIVLTIRPSGIMGAKHIDKV